MLIARLPPQSATKSAARDALSAEQLATLAAAPRRGHGSWSHTEMLLAEVIDRLALVACAVYAAAGGKPAVPKPYPRPGIDGRRRPGGLGQAEVAHLEDIRRANREAAQRSQGV